ncbi:AAA family ATPase [Rhodobacter capsulatus]|uniref:AAA family ATPase n=1 Tax=Rhodobacter capsulatus TaxID=1061 RepID=UPI00402837C3
MTTVIIGQNGAGKSNLIEAIVEIFRHLDPPTSKHGGKLRFTFEIDYIIKSRKVRASNRDGSTKVLVDGEPMPMIRFQDSKADLFPDLVFGYYSGTGRRLEKLFDDPRRWPCRTAGRARHDPPPFPRLDPAPDAGGGQRL